MYRIRNMDSDLNQVAIVIDDDKIIRSQLSKLLERAGISVRTYTSAIDFLSDPAPDSHGCLLLDVDMPGMTGLELQLALIERGIRLPIIFLTGHGTISMAVSAIKAGAVTFLEKPVDNRLLLDAVTLAFEHDRKRQIEESEQSFRQQLLDQLTLRERQTMDCLVEGQSNKEIARTLNISVRTVEIYRARVMQKLSADSVAELVKLGLQKVTDK